MKNKMLVVLVLICMLMSIATTFIALDRPSVTGYATNNVSGEINLNIDDRISVELVTNTITFGSCQMDRDDGYLLLDSTQNSSYADNGRCSGGSFPGYIVLENTGNAAVNISVQSNVSGRDFFGDPAAYIAFRALEEDGHDSCGLGHIQSQLQSLAIANRYYKVCDNMGFRTDDNRVKVGLQVYVTENSSSGGSVGFNFLAALAE